MLSNALAVLSIDDLRMTGDDLKITKGCWCRVAFRLSFLLFLAIFALTADPSILENLWCAEVSTISGANDATRANLRPDCKYREEGDPISTAMQHNNCPPAAAHRESLQTHNNKPKARGSVTKSEPANSEDTAPRPHSS